MQSLLLKSLRPGFPADYLVSRIHARKCGGVQGVPGPVGAGDSSGSNDTHIWNDFARERKWFYLQMEHGLRKIMAPVFLYFELDTLIFGLRSLGKPGAAENQEQSSESILSEDLQEALQSAAVPAEIVGRLEKFLAATPLQLPGIEKAYLEAGVQRCEELFRTKFYDQALVFCDHPQVRSLFQALIDLRNILTMAKALRWGKTQPQPLVEGGSVTFLKSDLVPSEVTLRKIIRRATRVSGLSAEELHPVRLETFLHEQLSWKMAVNMRKFEPVQCCCGYMWHSYMVAKKQSREFHGGRFAGNFSERGAIVQ